MPTLIDPRAEAFAQSRAREADLADAHETAGFGAVSRFAEPPKVAPNKPANRPNKPETARFRPDFASSGARGVGEDADRPGGRSTRLSKAAASPTTAPLSGDDA